MKNTFNEKMYELGSHRSVIRELFEYGKKRAEEVGADKVYDFSLGNPNVPAPACVNEEISRLSTLPDSTAIHGYTSAQGDVVVRKTIADDLNGRFNAHFDKGFVYMTCGAAASLTITLRALANAGDEFVVFAPFFPEYRVFIEGVGGKVVVVPFVEPDFTPDFTAFENAISKNTKGVIVNSPNNPSGAVYDENTVKKIAKIMQDKQEEFSTNIFLIADEPYREIVYDGKVVPFLPEYYPNTVVCYSFSKSLSLPGERIGYIALPDSLDGKEELYPAICGAGRVLGYVCAPSLMQNVVSACISARPDVDAYRENRDLLYGALNEIGYTCVHPDGAFYLFVKALEDDANAFSDRAKTFGLLLVPGDSFSAPGYVRASYCVSGDMIRRSIPAFKELFDSYQN